MNGALSLNKCRYSGGDTMRWWGTQTLPYEKEFKLFAVTGGGDAKPVGASTCVISGAII